MPGFGRRLRPHILPEATLEHVVRTVHPVPVSGFGEDLHERSEELLVSGEQVEGTVEDPRRRAGTPLGIGSGGVGRRCPGHAA